jgi:AAA15 family ATPase/GTPase
MRLTSIAISNIRSFKYNPHFTEPVTFAPTSTNLIIGPNASGKSNLIEVVKQLFSTVYDMAGTRYGFANDLNSLIKIATTSSVTGTTLTMPGTFI